MDAAQRELNDQIDFATQRLLDDARTIPEAGLRAHHCCRDGPGRMSWHTWPATPTPCGTC